MQGRAYARARRGALRAGDEAAHRLDLPRAVPWIRVGDRVRIVAGPLMGLEGLVREWRAGRATFVVSVDLLQRSVGVELDTALLQRAA